MTGDRENSSKNSSSKPNTSAPTPPKPENPTNDAPADITDNTNDTISALADFQNQLESLKKLSSTQNTLQSKLQAQQALLEKREREISERHARIQDAEQQLDRRRQDLDEDRAAVDRRREELESRRGELKSLKADLDRRAREHEEAHAQQVRELDALRAEAQALTAKLQQHEQTLAARDQAEKARDAELARKDAEAKAAANESQAQLEKITALESALTELRRDLESQRAEAASKQAAANADATRLRAREQELADQLVAAEAAAKSAASADLAASQALVAELTTLLAQRDEALAQRNQAAGTESAALSEREAAIRAEFDAALAAERARIAELSAELEQAKAASSQPHDHSEADAVIEQLKSRLKAEAAARRQAQESAATFAKQVEALQAQQTDLETEAAKAVAAMKPDAAALAESRRECERLRAKVGELEQHIQRLRDLHAESSKATCTPMRQQRVKRHRALRAAKIRKIRKAEAVVAKRYVICEQVISQRAQLAATHQIVMAAQSELEKNKAKGKTAVILFCSIAAVAVLAALSWALAGQTSPGRFAATSVVVADTRGPALTPDQLDAWQKYHEEKLTDPQFLDGVADHMQRQGITSLGSPGLLKERLKHDLSWQSPAPGELHVELRGEGSERTARELNTIVTKLAWDAMATRERRGDSAMTIISSEAKAGSEPIDEKRLETAGMYLGGSVSGLLLFSMLLYRRLARVKSTAERDEQIEQILEESRWPLPESAGRPEL